MERKSNRGDDAKILQIAKELIRSSDSSLFDAAGTLQVLKDAEIVSFFTGKSVDKILNERFRQSIRIMQHRENIREAVNIYFSID